MTTKKNNALVSLSVRNLTVSYGIHVALDELSLDFNAGELIGIIGPNGAGKTSFIKALCGRIPAEGEIRITGKAVRRGHDRRKLIGLVPQEIGLYTHLTAKENLDVIARLLSIPRLQRLESVDAALSAVGMAHKANVCVSDLSGGMKRRINVAAAIMHDPKVIIFDEPTAGVDVPARDTVHRLARDLCALGKTVLLVTHELDQAEALCDKIVLLADGKLLGFNSPSHLLASRFGNQREVVVRFNTKPNEALLKKMKPFEFSQGELPTIWKAMTDANEVSFVSAFMTALKNGEQIVREITVRRPGLVSLMHNLEISQAMKT